MKKCKDEILGIEEIFYLGFIEFVCLCKINVILLDFIMEGIGWVMCVVVVCEVDELEMSLLFLVIVGFISLYIGFFGMVWGIMYLFIVLGEVK